MGSFNINAKMLMSKLIEPSMTESGNVSALTQGATQAPSTRRHPGPPLIFSGSSSFISTPLAPLTPVSAHQHHLALSPRTTLPPSGTWGLHPYTFPLAAGSASSRKYPVVVEFATGKQLPNAYLDWVRRFVDKEMTNDNWGDEYMTAIGEQPRFMHFIDQLPDPHRTKDWETIWTAMNAEGERMDSDDEKKEHNKQQQSQKETWLAAFREDAYSDTTFSQPINQVDDEFPTHILDDGFREFAAAGIRGFGLYD